VIQSISGNLPPSIHSVPTEIRGELLQMQTRTIDDLRKIAQTQVPASQQKEHFELLDKNQSGLLTENERARLSELRSLADQLMLKKANACAILRWRGKLIQSLELEQLPPKEPYTFHFTGCNE